MLSTCILTYVRRVKDLSIECTFDAEVTVRLAYGCRCLVSYRLPLWLKQHLMYFTDAVFITMHSYLTPCCFDQLKCICQSVSSSWSIWNGMTYNLCNAAINCPISQVSHKKKIKCSCVAFTNFLQQQIYEVLLQPSQRHIAIYVIVLGYIQCTHLV